MNESLCCPVCHKKHPFPTEDSQCRRCGLDFTELLGIRRAADELRRAAMIELRQGCYEAALESAAEAWELQHHPTSARLACLACLAQGDLKTAATWSEAMTAP